MAAVTHPDPRIAQAPGPTLDERTLLGIERAEVERLREVVAALTEELERARQAAHHTADPAGQRPGQKGSRVRRAVERLRGH